MIGYKLTTEQYKSVNGVYFGEQFFNCVADINGNWFLFLSQQEESNLPKQFNYILDLPKAEYVPPIAVL